MRALTLALMLTCAAAGAEDADLIALRAAFANVKAIMLTQKLALPEGAPQLDAGRASVRSLLQGAGYTVVEPPGPADAEVELKIVGEARGAYYTLGFAYSAARVSLTTTLRCGGHELAASSEGHVAPPATIRSLSYGHAQEAPFAEALDKALPADELLAPLLLPLVPGQTLWRWVMDGKPAALWHRALGRIGAEGAPADGVLRLAKLLEGGDIEAACAIGRFEGRQGVEALKAGLTSQAQGMREACAFGLLSVGWRKDADMGVPGVLAALTGFVWVPPGEFMMGSPEGEGDYNEHPQHKVKITNGFWIGKYDVTNEQYARFLTANGGAKDEAGHDLIDLSDRFCDIERVGNEYRSWASRARHPVVGVSWYGAKAYCDFHGLVLPTEAQWEYAARGPQSLRYPWGNDWDPKKCCNAANMGPGDPPTMEVGSIPAGDSWCGASDMAGNVYQWCADWYDGDYYAESLAEDPAGPPGPGGKGVRWSSGGPFERGMRVVRGGSWASDYHHPMNMRTAARSCGYPSSEVSVNGFRCARGM